MESLQTAAALLYDLFVGPYERLYDTSPTDFLNALGKVAKEQMPLSIHGDVVDKSDPVILGFIHFSKWIVGSYGCFLPSLTTSDSTIGIPKLITGDEAYISFLLNTTHVAREDLLYSNFGDDSIAASSSTITPPPFFVLNDHQSQSVVLLIRGTKNLNDFIVDMSSASLPWEEGSVHEGMGLIATHIADSPAVRAAIGKGLQQHPNYRVRTVGHSLGAGLAALIAIRWNNAAVFPDVECFAFAPPPILTRSVKNHGERFVHSLVNEDDMIPRLNATCVRELARRVERAIDAKEREEAVKTQRSVRAWAQSLQSLTRSVKRNAQDMLNGVMAVADVAVQPALALVSGEEDGSWSDQWNSLRKRSRRWIADEERGDGGKKWKSCVVDELFLPGTIYYFHPCIGDLEAYMEYEREKNTMSMMSSILSVLPSSTVKYAPSILRMSPDMFPQVLRVSPNMLSHHSFSAYDKCLQLYCDHSSP